MFLYEMAIASYIFVFQFNFLKIPATLIAYVYLVSMQNAHVLINTGTCTKFST